MADWATLVGERPELAAAGQDLFRAFTIGYLATLRVDGTPRIHPVTVTLHEGGLYVSTIVTTTKAADLRERQVYALHAFPRFPDDKGWSDEEFMVSGTATEVADPARRNAIVAVHNDSVGPDDPFWELDIDRVFHKVRRDGRVVHTTWRARA